MYIYDMSYTKLARPVVLLLLEKEIQAGLVLESLLLTHGQLLAAQHKSSRQEEASAG